MRTVNFFLCAFLLCSTLEAQAGETKKPTKAELAYGKQLADEGSEAYQQQDWDQALTKFQEAYRLTQNPELLFHVAQCHQQKKQYTEATQSFEAFLNEAPKSAKRAEAKKAISELTLLKQEEQAKPNQEKSPAEQDNWPAYRTLYLISLSSGVGAIGTAVLSFSSLDEAREDLVINKEEARRGRSVAIASDALLLTSVITGSAAFVLKRRVKKQTREQNLTVSPMLSQPGVMLQAKF